MSVKKARKEQGTCGRCGEAIPKGGAYRWWKFRYGGKHRRCMEAACSPRASDLTGSDKLSTVYAAQENLEDTLSGWDRLDPADLETACEEAANTIREVAEEYRESKENMPEGLQEGDVGQQCEENADNLESWADEIESAGGDLEEFEGAEDPSCQECSGNGTKDCEECDASEETDEECKECQDTRSVDCENCEGDGEDPEYSEDAKGTWADEQVSKVEDVLGDCPL